MLVYQRVAGVIAGQESTVYWKVTQTAMKLVFSKLITIAPIEIINTKKFVIAEERMREAKINSLILADEEGQVTGELEIYDLQDVNK
jgi:hypothetical protein